MNFIGITDLEALKSDGSNQSIIEHNLSNGNETTKQMKMMSPQFNQSAKNLQVYDGIGNEFASQAQPIPHDDFFAAMKTNEKDVRAWNKHAYKVSL